MRTKVETARGEKILATFTHGTYFVNRFIARPARVTVSNKRIILEPSPLSAVLFGIFGALLGNLLKKHVHSIRYKNISSMHRSRIGLNKNIVSVTMNNGEFYRFGVQNMKRFKKSLLKSNITLAE